MHLSPLEYMLKTSQDNLKERKKDMTIRDRDPIQTGQVHVRPTVVKPKTTALKRDSREQF